MEHEEINALPMGPLLNPLQLRSTVASGPDTSCGRATHSRTSEQPSTPEESILGQVVQEHESQVIPREYSPSVYSVRRRSSVGNRDSEAQRRFSENLTRTIEERERLDEDWERERLEQEYCLPTSLEALEEGVEPFEDPDREQPEDPLSDPDPNKARAGIETRNSPAHERRVTRFELKSPTPTPAGEEEIPEEPQAPETHSEASDEPDRMEVIDFEFWSFEREQWRVSSRHWVDPSDPSIVERIAKKYIRKEFCIYDLSLNSLSPAICFRAGIADGTDAVFMLSREEEAKLVGEGRLKMSNVLTSVPRRLVPDRTERPSKRGRLRSESL